MAQQMKGECYTCHQEIYLSKPTPESKWVKTNLDGSAHVDPYQPRSKPATQQQQQTTIQTQPQQVERQNAISKAHDENMEAGERLRQSIIALTDRLTEMEKTFSIIANAIQAYLETKT